MSRKRPGGSDIFRRTRVFFLAPVALAAALLAGCNDHSQPANAAAAMGPMPVGVVTAQQSDVPLTNEWVGTLDGFVNANIQPQVSGYLIKQDYREGSVVQKGQVLFEIDPRPFQAALQQAEGQLGQAQGAVGQAQAQLQLAQINVNRDTPLAAEHAIATSQLDTEKQAVAQAQATVRSAQAQVAAAQAAVATARLNLGFTQVRSLITGVAGQATTQVGNPASARQLGLLTAASPSARPPSRSTSPSATTSTSRLLTAPAARTPTSCAPPPIFRSLSHSPTDPSFRTPATSSSSTAR